MWQFVLTGVCKGSVYGLMALGFGLIYSTTRVLHLAHSAVFVLAAYGLYIGTDLLRLPLGVGLLCGLVLAVVAGLLTERFVYWPLAARRAPGPILIISSFGVQVALVNLVTLVFGTTSQVAAQPFGSVVSLFGARITTIQALQLASLAVAFGAMALLLWRTRFGEIIRALADDPELASVLGFPVRRIRLVVIGLGSVLAALAGLLIFLDVGIEPHSGFPVMLAGAVACIVGGLRRLLAPAVGALLLGVLQSLVVWRVSGRWEEAVTFAILVAFLLVRPQGLFGVVQRVEE